MKLDHQIAGMYRVPQKRWVAASVAPSTGTRAPDAIPGLPSHRPAPGRQSVSIVNVL